MQLMLKKNVMDTSLDYSDLDIDDDDEYLPQKFKFIYEEIL